MGALSPTHWLIIIGVLVVLFGAKRLPEAARSLGRSARILKAEVGQMTDDNPAATPAPAEPHARGLDAGAGVTRPAAAASPPVGPVDDEGHGSRR